VAKASRPVAGTPFRPGANQKAVPAVLTARPTA
jgi:hypothetical protein